MGRMFGTDGVRGKAGVELTVQLAFALGQAAGQVLASEHEGQRGSVVIGRDTRISGQMLESGLAAGLMSVGLDVVSLGVIPTPGVAWAVRHYDALAGVVISASHNPFQDNGIKFFNSRGQKLSDQTEEAIEALVANPSGIRPASGHDIGRLRFEHEALAQYELFLNDLALTDRFRYRIIVDCANGASSSLAERLFKNLGVRCRMIGNEPDGVNINLNCGSTAMTRLAEAVVEQEADMGFAFDGDADRFLAVDHTGRIIDGDHLMAIYASYLKEAGHLQNNKLVATVMSNLGLKLAMRDLGIEFVETPVGDRYVNEALQSEDAMLGGEQSGHIIFREYNSTGDGLVSAIMLLNIMHKKQQNLATLAGVMNALPQVLINVPVKDKNGWQESPAIAEAIARAGDALADSGRVLVRASGTESLLRVMVEGPTLETTERLAREVSEVIEKERGTD